MVVAVVWYALREIRRAREAMEAEYERSERLLTNILPATIAERLKDPSRNIIADKYDDASILFADIAGYTKRASDTTPSDLVRFLDRLYTDLDALVDRHGLEKVKTSGDSYMVVSGVPEPREDHIEALACLALDMADAVADLKDPQGREVPLRIGLAAGPVVAGVVGARKFFYDVWGDAVNVAARMETTDVEGRIQVPQDVYERLNHAFLLEERGDVDIKGKGVMHTWYLVGRRDDEAVRRAVEQGAPAGSCLVQVAGLQMFGQCRARGFTACAARTRSPGPDVVSGSSAHERPLRPSRRGWNIAEPQRHSCHAAWHAAVVDALIDATVDVICARPCGSPT